MSTSVLNLRGIDAALVQRVKMAAAARGVTMRAYVVEVLSAAVGEPVEVGTGRRRAVSVQPVRIGKSLATSTDPAQSIADASTVPRLAGRADHDPKTCRVYKCGACAQLGHKDTHRGLS